MYVGGLEWRYFGEKSTLLVRALYNGSNYYGSKVSFEYQMIRNFSLVMSGLYQESLYDEDRFVAYTFNKNYTWYVQAAYTDNRSSIFTYDYDRFEALTGISFEF